MNERLTVLRIFTTLSMNIMPLGGIFNFPDIKSDNITEQIPETEAILGLLNVTLKL
jgi:hypothetical protein